MMLYYEEKIQWSEKTSAKNSKEQFARKMSAGRDQQIKTDYTENKILYFFSNNFIIVSYKTGGGFLVKKKVSCFISSFFGTEIKNLMPILAHRFD